MQNVGTAVRRLRMPLFKVVGPHLKIKQVRYVWVSMPSKQTWLRMDKAR